MLFLDKRNFISNKKKTAILFPLKHQSLVLFCSDFKHFSMTERLKYTPRPPKNVFNLFILSKEKSIVYYKVNFAIAALILVRLWNFKDGGS